MILLLFFIVGVLIGFLRSGDLAGIVHMNLRWIWLIILSFLAQSVFEFNILPPSAFTAHPILLPALQALRFLPLLLFAALNARNWRISLAGVGIALNFLVIAINGWQMPIGWQAASIPELAKAVAKLKAGTIPEYMLMSGYASASLWFLADIIPVKIFAFIPTAFASFGDMLLGIGVMLAIQHGMVGYSHGKHSRGAKNAARYVSGEEAAAVREEPAQAEPSDAGWEEQAPVTPAAYRREEPAPVAPAAYRREEPMPVAPAAPRRDTSATASVPTAKHVRREPASGKPAPAPVAQEPRGGRPTEASAEPQRALEFTQARSARESKRDSADNAPAQAAGPVKLSPRLDVIARMAERGTCVADIGCDHGKLAAWLATKGVPRVIAMDVSAKSLEKARTLIGQMGLEATVQTRVSDGLRKLRHGEADVIVMAGMGGPTMIQILEADIEKALYAEKLILQPMNAVGTVRKWLVDNGFRISDERLAEEDDRIYQILAAVPGDDPFPPMSLFDLEVGRLLVDCRHPLLGKLLENKMNLIDTILSEIADNATPKAEARRDELIALRSRCAEVREWLRAG